MHFYKDEVLESDLYFFKSGAQQNILFFIGKVNLRYRKPNLSVQYSLLISVWYPCHRMLLFYCTIYAELLQFVFAL
jgi:hypothetical protein